MSVTRYKHVAENHGDRYATFRSVLHVAAKGPVVKYRDYAALEAAAGEAREALVSAEIALCNCVPVVTYKGDGPLVKLRETLAHLDRVMGGK